MNAIIQLQGDIAGVKEIADATREQAEKTNGRVTRIEEWKNALIAVEQYKKEQQPTVRTEKGDVIVQAQASRLDAQTKVFLALAGLITAATVLIAAWGGKL